MLWEISSPDEVGGVKWGTGCGHCKYLQNIQRINEKYKIFYYSVEKCWWKQFFKHTYFKNLASSQSIDIG